MPGSLGRSIDGTEESYVVHLKNNKVEYIPNESLVAAKEQAIKELSSVSKPTRSFGM